MIGEIFDFEKKIASKNNIEEEKFIISGYPYFFRTTLLSRWQTLNKFSTYPNMIKLLLNNNYYILFKLRFEMV